MPQLPHAALSLGSELAFLLIISKEDLVRVPGNNWIIEAVLSTSKIERKTLRARFARSKSDFENAMTQALPILEAVRRGGKFLLFE